MNIYEIDWDEILLHDYNDCYSENKYSEEEHIALISQVNEIINNEKELPEMKALAYVIKFQLLMYQYKLSLKLLEKALELYPDMPEVLLRIGVYYYKKNRNKLKMRIYIKKALEKRSTYAIAWLFLAYTTDIKKEIFAYCRRYSKLKPDSSLGYQYCADYLYNQFRIDELFTNPKCIKKKTIKKLIFYFSKSISLNYRNKENYCKRSELYLLLYFKNKKDEYRQKAISDIDTYLENIPENELNKCGVWFSNLFKIFKLSKRIKNLIQIVKIASRLNLIYVFAYNELADCLSKKYCIKLPHYPEKINSARNEFSLDIEPSIYKENELDELLANIFATEKKYDVVDRE